MSKRRHVGLAAAIVSSAVLGPALPTSVAQADSTTLYVDGWSNSCSDSGAGAQAQPFCTVQAAANAAQPGQTVQIANKNYLEQVTVTHSGTPGHPITFKGSLASVGVSATDANASSRPHAFVLSGVHDVTLTGLTLTAPEEAVLVSDSDHITVDGNSLWSTGGGPTPAPGIRLTGKTTASTVSRNDIRSGSSGISVDAGVTGSVVTTNAVALDGPGITVTDAPGTVVTSNSVSSNSATPITLAGNSAGATVENNVVYAVNIRTSQPDLTVSAASTSGTKVDYNVVPNGPLGGGRVNYAWGTSTYTSPGSFATATGQGAHDLTTDSASALGDPPVEAIDSADATAPGELATDLLGNPRVDDPLIPNTGTGVGTYDRGATELQDRLSERLGASLNPTMYHPLDVNVYADVDRGAFGPATGTLDFGDGSPKVSLADATMRQTLPHSYPDSGTYTLSLTVTDGTLTRSSTITLTLAPVAPPQPLLGERQGPASWSQVLFDEGLNGVAWPVSTYTLDFGDGSPKSVNPGPLPPSSLISHTYPGPGTYQATLTATDDHGHAGTASLTVHVGALLPLNRTIEAVEGGAVHEIYSAADGWHDGAITGGGNVGAMDFAYSPTGARVIEAVEGGVLHEIYSAADGWHDNPIQGVAPDVSALSFTYNASGARVIEANEGGVLHEIYSAADGWHDNPIQGVGNITALSFTYNPAGQRVIEAVEEGVLREIYSAADGWHDNIVWAAGGGVSGLSLKIRPTGDRVVEAVESNMLHEIYTNNGAWYDLPVPVAQSGNLTAVSLTLR